MPHAHCRATGFDVRNFGQWKGPACCWYLLFEIVGLLELFSFVVVVVVATTYCVEIGLILIIITRVIVLIVMMSLRALSLRGSGPGGSSGGRIADMAMTRIVRVISR